MIAKDSYGNKYYENIEEELPCESQMGCYHDSDILRGTTVRTRWVDYHDKEFDPHACHLSTFVRKETNASTGHR